MSPVAATVERLQSNPPILKSKSLGVQVRDQRTLHSPVTRARRGRIMENAVALRFRLELGIAAPARGFTHAVPPRRLPLTAANSRPNQVQKRNAPGSEGPFMNLSTIFRCAAGIFRPGAAIYR